MRNHLDELLLTFADHRREVWALAVLGSVRLIDAIVRPYDAIRSSTNCSWWIDEAALDESPARAARRPGTGALPEPSPGDLFFDIEGDSFAFEAGIEYRFGLAAPARPAATGAPTAYAFWACDATTERKAFEETVDLIVEARRRDPHLHVFRRSSPRPLTPGDYIPYSPIGGWFRGLRGVTTMEIRASVGEGGTNDSLDVRTVQTLLNGARLEPAMPVNVTGVCDRQTIFLIEQLQVRVMGMPQATGLVMPKSGTWYALNGQSGPANSRNPYFDETLAALRIELNNFAQRFIQDATVRASYVAKAEEATREIIQAVDQGTLSAAEASAQARAMRNGLLDAARVKSSDIGRAAAEAEKATGLSMDALLERYSLRLFQKEFAKLSTVEQDAVFLEIARAAGRPNPKFTGVATKLGKAGKGLIIISIALAVYSVSTSDRPGREAVKQGSTAGVGFLGSLAGGATAGLFCGPGAPICVGVGVFVGGLAFALGADFAFDEIWE